jgi:hypothetical protein
VVVGAPVGGGTGSVGRDSLAALRAETAWLTSAAVALSEPTTAVFSALTTFDSDIKSLTAACLWLQALIAKIDTKATLQPKIRQFAISHSYFNTITLACPCGKSKAFSRRYAFPAFRFCKAVL